MVLRYFPGASLYIRVVLHSEVGHIPVASAVPEIVVEDFAFSMRFEVHDQMDWVAIFPVGFFKSWRFAEPLCF